MNYNPYPPNPSSGFSFTIGRSELLFGVVVLVVLYAVFIAPGEDVYDPHTRRYSRGRHSRTFSGGHRRTASGSFYSRSASPFDRHRHSASPFERRKASFNAIVDTLKDNHARNREERAEEKFIHRQLREQDRIMRHKQRETGFLS